MEYSIEEKFRERLCEQVEKSGLNLLEHSERSGIPYSTWQSWTSKKLPGSHSLAQLADYLSVSTDYLLGRDSEKTHDLQALYTDLGLTEDAVKSLQRFKQDDRVVGLPLIPGRVKCKALSEVLASPQVLEVLTSIMLIKRGEPGYYEGATHTKDGTFYRADLSPDSMAALLYLRLQLTLQQLRTGEAPADYAPAKRRDEAEYLRMLETGETDQLVRWEADQKRDDEEYKQRKAERARMIGEERRRRQDGTPTEQG